mmetsp:Transcript_8314/g.7363  ORF Transcript_8314/g.7363 Transcript_8314/m.7363 type:complete len:154 (+) Transcript_8314:333-794(+)
MSTLIKVANQEIIEKINLHCHYILSKHLKKGNTTKKHADVSGFHMHARDEIKMFLGPFFKFLSETEDNMHNASRLLQTLAVNTIETLVAHYSKANKKGFFNLKKLKNIAKGEPTTDNMSGLSEDVIVYNELFQDINSEQVRVMYQKFKQLVRT